MTAVFEVIALTLIASLQTELCGKDLVSKTFSFFFHDVDLMEPLHLHSQLCVGVPAQPVKRDTQFDLWNSADRLSREDLFSPFLMCQIHHDSLIPFSAQRLLSRF